MFLGRRLKTRLPTATPLLKPQHSDEIRKSLKQRQIKQKHYYDKHANKEELMPLKSGENVIMRHENKWKHGTIERKHESPRSYVVQTPDGRKYRRNRKHIRPTKSVPLQEETEEIFVPTYRDSYPSQTASYQNEPSSTSHQHETTEDISPSELPELKVKLPRIKETSPYKTRSGRIVKPPIRYSET